MSNNNDIAVRVESVSKTFRLPHEKHTSMKSAFLSRIRHSKGYEIQEALKDISFEVKKGEFFGIVGRNGSGKSTLLKCIAGVYTPNRGKIHINGKLVPFIELGVGFNPELSGRDNIFLNGALLGFSRKQMEAMYDEIVEFAELEQFMDQKLKNYSSGMQVRLAFSIAIRAKGDVLLLDEVLAVGDAAFQKKCYQYFAELKKEKKTVILVTHDMGSVQRFCSSAIMIEGGKIVEQGNTAKVTQKYIELNNVNDGLTKIVTDRQESPYASVKVKCDRNKKRQTVDFNIDLEHKSAMPDSVLALLLLDEAGRQVYRWTTEKITPSVEPASIKRIHLSLEDIFPVGVFSVNIRILKRDRSKDYATFFNIAKFEVTNESADIWDVHWHPKENYHIEG